MYCFCWSPSTGFSKIVWMKKLLLLIACEISYCLLSEVCFAHLAIILFQRNSDTLSFGKIGQGGISELHVDNGKKRKGQIEKSQWKGHTKN